MKVGFIGLGIMGYHMACNLSKGGYQVYAYDIMPEAVERAEKSGCIGCASIKEVADQCEDIITMLPNGPHVKSVVLGNGGIAEFGGCGTFIIDMSSIAPGVSREIAEELSLKGIHMMDAPVSGGEPKAADGTLAIMAGGLQPYWLAVWEAEIHVSLPTR